MTIRVVCYGLGPIGIGIARLALARTGVEVVGAIDLDPQKIGRDLGALVGAADAGVIASGERLTSFV
jgi:4-hydroxy-tetrahydrodipicolinate reductase